MTAPLVPGAPQLAVESTDDVLEQLPLPMRRAGAVAPTRDAIVAGLFAILDEFQYRSGYADAQADPGRATGIYLDAQGEERQVPRGGATEEDDAYRARVVGVPQLVSFDAVRAAVDEMLAAWTSGTCQVWDAQLDRLFVRDAMLFPVGVEPWYSFIDTGPSYPDRYFENDAAAPVQLAGNDPRGAVAYDDCVGRMFHVAIPDLRGVEDLPAFVYDGAASGSPPVIAEASGLGMYPGDGSSSTIAAFVYSSATTPEYAYAAIIAEVERLKGFGVRWVLNTDTRL